MRCDDLAAVMMTLKFDLKNAQLSVVKHMQVAGEELQDSDGLCNL